MEETKLTLTNLLIALSILFSIGGAFNVGFTGFWMAVPFMLLLGFLTFKKSRIVFVYSLGFILLCVIINLTIYKNPLVFPVLKKGTKIEVVNESLYRKSSDESGSFIKADDIYINEPTQLQKEALNNFLNNYSSSSLEISDSAISTKNNIAIIFKFRKEQKIDIKGVYNYGAIDSSNANYLITKFGNIGEDAVRQGNIRVLPNTPIQSNWSKYLGNLMYWPVFPIILLTGFK